MENEKIILSEAEIKVLEAKFYKTFNPLTATPEETEIELALIDRADDYVREHNQVDAMCDYTNDCDLLAWYYHVWAEQNGVEHDVTKRDTGATMMV